MTYSKRLDYIRQDLCGLNRGLPFVNSCAGLDASLLPALFTPFDINFGEKITLVSAALQAAGPCASTPLAFLRWHQFNLILADPTESCTGINSCCTFAR